MRISDWSSDVCSSDLLRNQTQGRIDEGFIGRDTGRLEQRKGKSRPRTIGVGNFDDRRVPVSLTNTIKDFNKATATTNTSQISSYAVPVVLVIKKNSRTLGNLVDWLKEHSVSRGSEMVDQPMRSEEHTSELQSLMRISYAVFCLQKK